MLAGFTFPLLPQDTAGICSFPASMVNKKQSGPALPFVPTNAVCLFVSAEQALLIYVNWNCTGIFFSPPRPPASCCEIKLAL